MLAIKKSKNEKEIDTVSMEDMGEQVLETVVEKIKLKNDLVFEYPVVEEKLREYLISCRDIKQNDIVASSAQGEKYKQTIKVNLPSIEGFRVYLGITKSLWGRWEEELEFKNLIGFLEDVRSIKLQANGLSGDYSPVLAKLFLSKLGYTDNEGLNSINVGGNAIIMIPEKVPLDPNTNLN